MSAVGFLTAPLAFDFVRSWRCKIDAHLDWQKANTLLNDMELEGLTLLETSGVPTQDIRYRREVDIRHVGQGHEIRVPLPTGQLDHNSIPGITAAFEEVYRRLYERLSLSVPIEIINWRVTASGPTPEVHLQLPRAEHTAAHQVRKGSRQAYFPESGGYQDTPVYNRYGLSPGTRLTGPAIVEERESTVIIGPNSYFSIDEQWNLIVEFQTTF
jgi:N-methylhydantoinase A